MFVHGFAYIFVCVFCKRIKNEKQIDAIKRAAVVNNGLLDYVEFYDTNNEGKPTPKHKITFVGTKVKGMRKAKTPQPQQPQSEFVF